MQLKMPSVKTKIKGFLNESDRLFDICWCKCICFKTCFYKKTNKVPRSRQDFLLD